MADEIRRTYQEWAQDLVSGRPLTWEEFRAAQQQWMVNHLYAVFRHVERLEEGRVNRLELWLIRLTRALMAMALPIPPYLDSQHGHPEITDDIQQLEAVETDRATRKASA